MPKNNETNQTNGIFEDYFDLPNPGLRSYFDIVEKGQPDEYRTTFYKGKSLDEVLAEWSHTLESLSRQWPTLVDFENDLKAKVGPLSIMKPLSERLEDIDHYYDDILLSSTPVSDSAIKAVLSEFSSIKGLRVRSQVHTVEKMKKSTNSGSPYFRKRKDVLNITIVCFLMEEKDKEGNTTYRQFLKAPSWRELDEHTSQYETKWYACAVLGWRGQEGGPTDDDVKQRVVWMFPLSVNICELQVYQPLIESCQKFNLVPAWVSMDDVDLRITRMFDTKGKDDLVICTDFSKFDQHFNEDMQNAARSILEGLLGGNSPRETIEASEWLGTIFPIKYNIPLAYDFNKIRFGKHGMGSGSGGTNADETLAHRALQYEAAQSSGKLLNPNSQCLGDDGVLTYPGITVEDVVRSYTAHGQEMNESKQYASKHDCIYLRRWHHTDYRIGGVCVGVYSTYRALGRLMEQERFYEPEEWSAQMVALRQLSIIENCKYHPLRDQFAEFCMKGDKYRLGIDLPGFLDNIDNIAKEATDFMPDFLGYTKSMNKDADKGISSWWIVNYLRLHK